MGLPVYILMMDIVGIQFMEISFTEHANQEEEILVLFLSMVEDIILLKTTSFLNVSRHIMNLHGIRNYGMITGQNHHTTKEYSEKK